MKGDNVFEAVHEEACGIDQQQLGLSAETFRVEITKRENVGEKDMSVGHSGGSNIALQPGLSLPKIGLTNSNWTVSGTGKSDNDIPGRWFLMPDDEEKRHKKANKTASPPREPDGRSSTRSLNKVPNGTGVGLPRKHDTSSKDTEEIDYTNKYIEMSKYLRLKKKFDDSQERLTNCLQVINKWYEKADNCKQNYNNLQSEGIPSSEKNEMETLDMWKGKAMEYKAKYNTACKQLKTFKSEYDEAKRIEGEVNMWIVNAKETRIKYRDLCEDYDNLLIRFKEACKK
ncbi:hypothetical protein LOTGIDRAFT_229103 [Lottia gigantea]|uniref:Uncharacterized protein n=1 Tax=Lottia gigantea TaxID=225164 RepID=V4A2P4_LOTGI|nr:hypothetical protein LOTGIDRAFT_229103 [Lottia gigantea]ESO89210.1 hypothetical protein LOTGIDRAFT_229103 [Lottia gigantea]